MTDEMFAVCKALVQSPSMKRICTSIAASKSLRDRLCAYADSQHGAAAAGSASLPPTDSKPTSGEPTCLPPSTKDEDAVKCEPPSDNHEGINTPGVAACVDVIDLVNSSEEELRFQKWNMDLPRGSNVVPFWL